MNAIPYIPLNLPYIVTVEVPYYRGVQCFDVIGYIPSENGFLCHTTLILQGQYRDGRPRIIKKLEQQVGRWVSDDDPDNICEHNGGLLQKLTIL